MTRASEYFIANAFAFVGTHDPTPQEIGELSSEILRKRYRELFATVDLQELATRLMAWIRVNAPLDSPLEIDEQVSWAELAIYELLQRGAIRQVVQTPEAIADLQKLQAAVEKAGLRPAPVADATADAEPQPVVIDPIDKCISDFKLLPSSEFRKLWMNGTNRQVFDKACAEGRL